jgi:tRNA(Leu) C34 or U34 (ribose-2'-O)-methylase TrmL
MKPSKMRCPSRPGVPVYIVPKDLMDHSRRFNIHRGCLATANGRRGQTGARASSRHVAPSSSSASAMRTTSARIFRSAAAFGADAVLTGPACADPLYRKAIRTSMGAALTLPFADADPWPAALTMLKAEGWAVAAFTPAADAMPLRDFASATRPSRVAIVLGHEGEGLTDEALAACEFRVRIPIHAAVDS